MDLEKLGKEIDILLKNETKETLTKWLNERRNNFNTKTNLNIPDVGGCSAIHFGRFLMKYCTVKYDKEGYLVYEYEGVEYNTDELYKLFCNNR